MSEAPVSAFTHFDPFEYQLVASGDGLVLLAPPQPKLAAVALVAPAQRSFFIDPHTGGVRALGPVRIVPEPAGLAALLLAAVTLRRRR